MSRSKSITDQWIDRLNLQAHPEGGFYHETYRSTDQCRLERYNNEDRLCSGAIYYLLRSPDQPKSVFHRIKADEMWHFYAGGPLIIHVLDEKNASHTELILHNDFSVHSEARPQILIPHGKWFAAELFHSDADTDQYTLCGCTCTPGFDFKDFELAKRSYLLEKFSHLTSVITRLTPDD